jgi:hypothetical protein
VSGTTFFTLGLGDIRPSSGSAKLEEWCAELLESHVSYPMLGYFRSQHDRQSWLAAVTSILDVCSLTMTVPDRLRRSAWAGCGAYSRMRACASAPTSTVCVRSGSCAPCTSPTSSPSRSSC